MVEITRNMLVEATKNGNDSFIALNTDQLNLLGISWPPKRGWVRELIGKEMTEEDVELLLALKGLTPFARKQILQGDIDLES